MQFFQSNLFTALLTFVLTSAFTFYITWHFTKKNYKTKILECILLEKYSPVKFSSEILKDVKITYDGSETNSIQVFKLRIENVGLEAIKTQPIIFKLEEKSVIKRFTIAHFPEELFGNIDAEIINNNKLSLSIDLLNPMDNILLEIVSINGINDSIEIFAKNENVIIKNYNYKKEMSETLSLMNEIVVNYDNPILLLPYLPKILKTYPSLYRLTKVQNKIKKDV